MERRKAGKSIQELPWTASFTPGVNSSTAPVLVDCSRSGLDGQQITYDGGDGQLNCQ